MGQLSDQIREQRRKRIDRGFLGAAIGVVLGLTASLVPGHLQHRNDATQIARAEQKHSEQQQRRANEGRTSGNAQEDFRLMQERAAQFKKTARENRVPFQGVSKERAGALGLAGDAAGGILGASGLLSRKRRG